MTADKARQRGLSISADPGIDAVRDDVVEER
jgi:hypothetical protein